MPMQPSLDRYDEAILEILQQNNTTPQRVIAEAVNLSAPAVQRRIRKLEENGVIRANVALVDPDKVGLPLTILIAVQVVSERVADVAAFQRRLQEESAVQQCYTVAGETDYMLIVSVKSMQAYEALTDRLFGDDDNIKHFRTSVALKRLKVGTAVPLAHR
jgi:Lrp/AsnC family transcriptional regulator, leucine-responsive regulatory protein